MDSQEPHIIVVTELKGNHVREQRVFKKLPDYNEFQKTFETDEESYRTGKIIFDQYTEDKAHITWNPHSDIKILIMRHHYGTVCNNR